MSILEKAKLSITFDDVLLVPKKSPVQTRKDVKLKTRLTKSLYLNNPLVSSNMDSVTESEMAISLARNGGIGILHRFLSIDEQVSMVQKVKRAESYIIEDPYAIAPYKSIKYALEYFKTKSVSALLVTENGDSHGILKGIITSRDIRFAEVLYSDSPAYNGIFPEEMNNILDKKVEEIMTPFNKLIVAPTNITPKDALLLLYKNKIEKLPLVTSDNHVFGMISAKDILTRLKRPYASLDTQGKLMVGAAIGVKDDYLKRAKLLYGAGVDVIVIDIAHGHSDIGINATKSIKEALPKCQLIAGNVATKEGTEALINAGADGVKVGIGPGSICITRDVTGCGVPQLSAIAECAEIGKKYQIPIMADGGIRKSGDIVKAIAIGAETVMLGSLLAGTDESPGQTIVKGGRKMKVYRGMAGFGANMSKKEREKRNNDRDIFDIVPEGVEAAVPYRGSVIPIIHQLVGGLKSGISYCGGVDINNMQTNAEFIRITGSGKTESTTHDVQQI